MMSEEIKSVDAKIDEAEATARQMKQHPQQQIESAEARQMKKKNKIDKAAGTARQMMMKQQPDALLK